MGFSAEAIEGVVKRIDLLGCNGSREIGRKTEILKPENRTKRTASTGAVGQVVGGIRRQHAS